MEPFTPGELEVMKILWDHAGELSPRQIQQAYPRPIRNAAVRFQLRALLDKGHITRRRVGKAYRYQALTPREGIFRSMSRRLAELFFNGSAAGLIAELIRTERLSSEEIEQLQLLAASQKQADNPELPKG